MKYVGIKNSKFKSLVVAKAAKRGIKKSIKVDDLIARDCDRHLEILSFFDKKIYNVAGLQESLYYKFQKGNSKKDSDIQRKVNDFKKLYLSIKKKGYKKSSGRIIVSDDGARLDGSHRSAILKHLGYESVEVIVVKWSDYLKSSQIKGIKKHLKHQQKKYC